MNYSNSPQKFHSGQRLQRLREFEGLSRTELAEEFNITSSVLQDWEDNGVPEESIKECCYYFEVSDSIFSVPIASSFELDKLLKEHLFPKDSSFLTEERLERNKKNQDKYLDLSGLALNKIPEEVFGFFWLTSLNISNNQIKRIPSRILLLSQLECFDISGNLLQQIPGLILAISTLKAVSFQGNPLNLQPDLSTSGMTLDAVQEYLQSTKVTLTLTERLTEKSLQCLDEIRQTVEQTQALIIAKAKTCRKLAARYSNLSCMICLAEDTVSANLSQEILPHQSLPLIVFFSDHLGTTQYSEINIQLNALFPPPCYFFRLIRNKTDFSEKFNEIQRGTAFQNQLAVVRFERLVLENIGVYEQLDIELNPDVAVFIGLNVVLLPLQFPY
ncbi:MAG: hypothetical protein D3910_21130 [Candidatus Electrothrix sp. ATG2]|nr:hypothetical protein [Candidatus Electrothrix sp. ATG2]